MGERKGTNKYYPPDFDPKKHGSLAGYHGQHPLRERARKMSQGILIIRFEMPYNIWCGGCNSHIGMGVRYNAEKSKIGNYYTTPIYKFRMKCHLCDNHFEIKTDPASHDYIIISGARRKEQRWDPKENEQVVPEDRETHKKIERDAMYRLEHGSDDKNKLKGAIPGIKQIQALQMDKKDDYLLNKMARHKFREVKKAIQETAASDQALLDKSSLDLKLVEEREEDVRIAQLLKYKSLESYDEKQKQKRETINNRPLFQGTNTDSDSNTSKSGSIPSSSGSSTPSTLNPKQATLQRIGMASSNRRRSNPFGTDASESVSSSKKMALTKTALGIVRPTTIKQTESEVTLKETKLVTEHEIYEQQTEGTNQDIVPLNDHGISQIKGNDNMKKDSRDENVAVSDNQGITAERRVNSSIETEKESVQQNALNNLFSSYASSDSSGSDD